jgi:hypothetical protein
MIGMQRFLQRSLVSLLVHTGLACLLLLLAGCSGGEEGGFVAGTEGAEETVGERLFLETRFAQAFKVFLDNGGGVNTELPAGDPVLDDTQTTGQPLPGPFAGLTISISARLHKQDKGRCGMLPQSCKASP